VNRQIGVGDSKNVLVFDPLLTGHVIRRMRSLRVRIFHRNQRETLTLITQERIGVGSSNLVGIIDVGVDACGILFTSVGQTNRKWKYGGHSEYKMQKSTKKRRQIAEILRSNRKSGSANRTAVSKFTPEVHK